MLGYILQTGSNDLMRRAQIFVYANGNDRPPTAIDLEKSLLKELLFNQSPTKVIFVFMQKCIILLFYAVSVTGSLLFLFFFLKLNMQLPSIF